MEAASVKRVWAGILAVGILLGMSGCAANKEGAVKENGKASGMEKVLRVGGEATYPPFLFKDEHGHYVGFEMDQIDAATAMVPGCARYRFGACDHGCV